jgi:hypothetical protein
MSLQVITGKDGKTGIFIPLEDWNSLHTTVRPHSPIHELMEELSTPAPAKMIRQEYVLPSGLTIQEVEEESRKDVEAIYIDSFIKGLPQYYEDDRTKGEKDVIRAMPDGSEDLVEFDLQTGEDTFIRQLLPAGQGKFAYLLQDDRYISRKKR